MPRWPLALALALAALLGRLADARGAPRAALGCIAVTVSELDRATRFYEAVLDFRRAWTEERSGRPWERLTGVSAGARTARLRLGEECLELTEWAAAGSPVPGDSRSNDRWFQHVAIVVGDMDRAFARLREARVEGISPEPQRIPDSNPAAGGIRAFYFRDPDRHALELIWFPAGRGDPRWAREAARGDALFLGIDHTAIASGDTAASLRFWRDALGLEVAGGSLNHGVEQERLSGVPGARVRITGLRAARGPGVELLEYLEPRGGRPYPPGAGPADLVHWQIEVAAGEPGAAAGRALAAGGTAISPEPVALPPGRAGARRAWLGRDPDGHAVALVERGAE